MSQFNIPTPKDVDYYNSNLVADFVKYIAAKLNIRIFEFNADVYTSVDIKEVNKILISYGWELTKKWVGGHEDGHSVYVLKPKDNSFTK